MTLHETVDAPVSPHAINMPSYDYGSELLEMDLPKRKASVEVKLVDEHFSLLSSPNSTDYEVLAVKR
jgi:hypothetical protein